MTYEFNRIFNGKVPTSDFTVQKGSKQCKIHLFP